MVARGSVAGARILALAASALLLFIVNAVVAPQSAIAQAPGPDVCAGCHEDYVKSFTSSMHGKTGDPKSPASNGGCVACHGDGTEHVKAGGGRGVGGIINPGPGNKKMAAEAKSAICLACHSTARELAFWEAGQHKKNDVTCSNCHNPHASRAGMNDKMLRGGGMDYGPYRTTSRQLPYETCVACHREQRAQILKPSHHPIIEGKIQCHNCHNPHGAMTPVMLRAENYQDLCLTCHTDKRGPWIHEHPPVMENCATCHTPHGSAHNRLLAQKPPALCADCHPGGHTHGVYDGRGTLPNTNPSNVRFEGSGCVNCHRAIHGSNAPPSAYGQYFLR